MEEQLPSYQEALIPEDRPAKILVFLRLVAPYLHTKDYRSLSLLDRGCYNTFAPLLFRSPLAVRAELTNSLSDHAWHRKLMGGMMRLSRHNLHWVTTLDFRTISAISGPDEPDGVFTARIYEISYLTPNLRCLVADNCADFNPSRCLGNDAQRSSERPLLSPHVMKEQARKTLALLSLKGCAQAVPDWAFYSQSLPGLVYLDLSYTVIPAGYLHGKNLPNLRILKLSHKGMDSSAGAIVLKSFPCLWSLDVSGNPMYDAFVFALQRDGVRCGSNKRLQSEAYFEVEGKLSRALAGNAYFIDESNSSETFSHPDRYLADSPGYSRNQEESDAQPSPTTRLVGTELLRRDTLDDAITVLSGGSRGTMPAIVDWPNRIPPASPRERPPGYLTHLHLNGMEVALKSIENLLINSCGYLELFECDRARFFTSSKEKDEWRCRAPWLSPSTILYGFHGSAPLFRPVFSSNLRVLKIHHSLVTNTPTVSSRDTSVLENIWAAEKLFKGCIDLAYPQRYMPDMNPRLYSLTLARIQPYSTGVVANRIIDFLKLLARQEQAIEWIKKLTPYRLYRGPVVLRGIRHLCLEFDDDAKEAISSLDEDGDVNHALRELEFLSDGVLDSALTSPGPSREPTRVRARLKASLSRSTSTMSSTPVVNRAAFIQPQERNGRFHAFPYTHTLIDHYTPPNTNLRVWVGSGRRSRENSMAINWYMLNLTQFDPHSVGPIQPVTPYHVQAGVPAGEYIFRNAWEMIAFPREDFARPTREDLEGMCDVAEEIKAFRQASRKEYERLQQAKQLSGEVGQHEYYKGSVEILRSKAKKKQELMYGQ